MAAGAWLGGKLPMVLMQNSGLGVSVNALASLTTMYALPVLLVISWRGEGGNDGPDHYVFHVVASHEHIRGLVREAFGLLPEEVTPIVEVDSTDAYRSVDVFVGREPIPLDDFLDVWDEFEPILMEDASLGRQMQSSLASNEQAWRSGESYLDRQFQQGENAATRSEFLSLIK